MNRIETASLPLNDIRDTQARKATILFICRMSFCQHRDQNFSFNANLSIHFGWIGQIAIDFDR